MDKSDASVKVDQQSGIAASHLAPRAAIRNITEAEQFPIDFKTLISLFYNQLDWLDKINERSDSY